MTQHIKSHIIIVVAMHNAVLYPGQNKVFPGHLNKFFKMGKPLDRPGIPGRLATMPMGLWVNINLSMHEAA
jgi:hypothetical protein